MYFSFLGVKLLILLENINTFMLKIGFISDTHAHWDEKFAFYFVECDEIWHAGDIGSEAVLN
jgi:hypothetical protein